MLPRINDVSRMWVEFPSHMQLPSGPFWPLGLLVLGPGIYALDNILVTRSFGPNSLLMLDFCTIVDDQNGLLVTVNKIPHT